MINLIRSILLGLLAFILVYFIFYSIIWFVELACPFTHMRNNIIHWSGFGRFILLLGVLLAITAGLVTGFTFYRPADQLALSGNPTARQE